MQALLLVAHGSRREASNHEVCELAARLQRMAGNRFDAVVPAFLELAEPDIAAGVDRCVNAGATHVTVLPYFLAAGRHVTIDIPAELARAADRHHQVNIQQCDYLGAHQSIAEVLLAMALDGPHNAGGSRSQSEETAVKPAAT